MKTILAPTDFSEESINAVNYAADLAVAINAKLALFHAIPFPIAVSEISMPEDFIDDKLQNGHNNLDSLCQKLKLRTNDQITITTEIQLGGVEQELEVAAKKERPLPWSWE